MQSFRPKGWELNGAISSVGRALDCGSRCRGFEPHIAPQIGKRTILMSFSFCFSPMRRAALFALASSFLAVVAFAAGNALLLSAVCGIRYRRGPSMVRNMRAVLKKASWGTRRIFRGTRCKKQAFPVRKGYSVRRTVSCGTRRIMDIRYSPPSLVRNRSLDAKKGHHRNNTKKQDKSCDLSCLVAGAGLEPTTSGL